MASSYTSLLGLVQPATGDLNNTWGTVVNAQLTQLVEDSVAGISSQDVTSSDWTLTTTGGGASNQARTAILIVTGAPGTTRYIYAPKQSKMYVVINNCTDQSSVYLRGGPTSPTTGTLIAATTAALCAWNGNTSDFIKVAGGGGASGGGSNQVFFQNDQTVSVSYTIPNNTNAGTFGPITVNSGVTVTVPSGGVWTIV
jgi:hypothetical protein